MKIEEKYISDTVRKGIGLLAEIHKRKHEAYIAGGAVRDLDSAIAQTHSVMDIAKNDLGFYGA